MGDSMQALRGVLSEYLRVQYWYEGKEYFLLGVAGVALEFLIVYLLWFRNRDILLV